MVCIAPLLYVDLRAEISPEVSATDASQQAAGVCRTTSLTVAGRRFLRDAHSPKSPRSADEVVLLGQFDGISALRVAWDTLGLSCHAYHSIDIDDSARRVVESEWPGVRHTRDVRDVDADAVMRWRDHSPSARYLVEVSGFPCQDLSNANPKRKGLAGARSGLFYEMVRVHGIIKSKWPGLMHFFCGENVAGMPGDAEAVITSELGVPPLSTCASLFSWVRRPRLLWMNWAIFDHDGITLKHERHRLRLRGEPMRGPCSAWLEKGARWLGASEERPRCLPTLLRFEPVKSPRVPAHGLEACSASERDA